MFKRFAGRSGSTAEPAADPAVAAASAAAAAGGAPKHRNQASIIRDQVANLKLNSSSSRVISARGSESDESGGGGGDDGVAAGGGGGAGAATSARDGSTLKGGPEGFEDAVRSELRAMRVSYRALEAENVTLQRTVSDQHKRLVVAEEKLEQVLALLNSDTLCSVIEKEEAARAAEEGSGGDGSGGGSGPSVVARKLRGFVSLKKYRFQKDGFDLDLSYITPQIIAMGYPTEGVEAVYRNPLREVQRFFETYHEGKYKIYNLCCEAERQYDASKFKGRVANFPFQDHNACALSLLRPCCEDIHAWLSADPTHVAAVHCKAGKGRTGTIIAAYLAHCGLAPSADDALTQFGTARTMNGKGVTIPSQQRFVRYYGELVNSGFSLPTYMYTVNSIRMSPVPSFHYTALGGGCTPYFHVYWVDATPHKIFDSRDHIRTRRFKASDAAVEFTNLNALDLAVGGTIKVQFFQEGGGKMCHCWLHTAFFDAAAGSITLSKREVDKAHNDKQHFDASFSLTLCFEKEDEAPLTDPEYLLDEGGSAYTMGKVGELMASLQQQHATQQQGGGMAGGHVGYRHHRALDEEWDDDEQEMLQEEEEQAAGGAGDEGTGAEGALGALRDSRSESAFGFNGPTGYDWLPRSNPAQSSTNFEGNADKVRTVKEGWLNKKGGSRRNWKKRWFMLQVRADGQPAARDPSIFARKPLRSACLQPTPSIQHWRRSALNAHMPPLQTAPPLLAR